jgi:hypothetical protein
MGLIRDAESGINRGPDCLNRLNDKIFCGFIDLLFDF